jgi:DNA-binding NarL/FixJ family response regulator
MARVLALVPDLLFGSRVQAALAAAGDDVELIADEGRLRELLTGKAAPGRLALVVDLTDDALARAELVESLSRDGALAGVRTLAFYSHVHPDTRQRAERAGIDLVVPRSRMAREAAELVAGLLARA